MNLMGLSRLRTGISYSKWSRIRSVLRIQSSIRTHHQRPLSSTTTSKEETEHFEGEDDSQTLGGYRQHPRYEGHIPTTTLQKVLLTAGSAGMAIINPARDDMVATLGDVTGYSALKWMKQKMEADPVGRQILLEQPVIKTSTVSIDYLGSLPDNMFGKAYWRFLDRNGFSPDARLPVHFVDDPELVYVMLRYRQCHDLFHTILGMKPNMLGEVAVKMVEAFQTGLPMCVFGALFGPVRLGPVHRQRYFNTLMSWAIRNGRNAKFLMAVYFEKHWEDDLDDLRKRLNIEPPPEVS